MATTYSILQQHELHYVSISGAQGAATMADVLTASTDIGDAAVAGDADNLATDSDLTDAVGSVQLEEMRAAGIVRYI